MPADDARADNVPAMPPTNGPATRAPAPRLVATRVPEDASGVALLLHGGGGRGTVPVSPTQLSVLRMVPIAARVARAGRGRIAVYRLLNAVRGFGADPLSNVRWALEELRRAHPARPICLIGHSLGGSVALAAAAEGDVRAVVALAPWLSGSESLQRLGATPALIVHGTEDRVTSCRAAQRFAEQARRAGAPVSFVEVLRGEHSMLRRMPAFDVLAASYTTRVLDPGLSPGRRFGYWARLDELATRALAEPADYTL